MSDFSDVKIGDKLWSIQLGECKVKHVDNKYVYVRSIADNFDNNDRAYCLNGNYNFFDNASSLYWSKPEITGGEKPKPRKLYAYNDKYGVVQHQITDDGLIINRRNIEYHRCEAYDIEYKD